ncbi:MAG TPA: class D sortase [Bacillota bacterium]|nr:class D sortase [Bacillota bacterium]
MRRWISRILMIVGLALISISGYQFYQTKQSTNNALAEAEQLVKQNNQNESEDESQTEPSPEDFVPKDDDVIGIVRIPSIEAKLPIVEGTDEEMLKKGVGHYSSTALPAENEQILLSGHRDTVFRRFGELEIGDRFIVEMPYGTYEYEMRESEIVGADDTSVIRPMGEEVLTVSTCYPFSYIGNAPDRFVLYAYPVGETEDKDQEEQ